MVHIHGLMWNYVSVATHNLVQICSTYHEQSKAGEVVTLTERCATDVIMHQLAAFSRPATKTVVQ